MMDNASLPIFIDSTADNKTEALIIIESNPGTKNFEGSQKIYRRLDLIQTAA